MATFIIIDTNNTIFQTDYISPDLLLAATDLIIQIIDTKKGQAFKNGEWTDLPTY